MKYSNTVLIILIYLAIFINRTQQQTTVNITITTCNDFSCNLRRTPCSTNLDCECFAPASNSSTGICASALISCSSLPACDMNNRTCSYSGTICVQNTRCGEPVCYPTLLASTLICPPLPTTRQVPLAPQVRLVPQARVALVARPVPPVPPAPLLLLVPLAQRVQLAHQFY
ncbi:unnamed protein product [Adineta ricciae]|uniref:Uncharacterized protein n=1 Tax=Adineta ricciae TaxID=249248 RepID=A0A815VIZ4_ADIRI|nr:unnamed protein product [Adineta ricciae]